MSAAGMVKLRLIVRSNKAHLGASGQCREGVDAGQARGRRAPNVVCHGLISFDRLASDVAEDGEYWTRTHDSNDARPARHVRIVVDSELARSEDHGHVLRADDV